MEVVVITKEKNKKNFIVILEKKNAKELEKLYLQNPKRRLLGAKVLLNRV